MIQLWFFGLLPLSLACLIVSIQRNFSMHSPVLNLIVRFVIVLKVYLQFLFVVLSLVLFSSVNVRSVVI